MIIFLSIDLQRTCTILYGITLGLPHLRVPNRGELLGSATHGNKVPVMSWRGFRIGPQGETRQHQSLVGFISVKLPTSF